MQRIVLDTGIGRPKHRALKQSGPQDPRSVPTSPDGKSLEVSGNVGKVWKCREIRIMKIISFFYVLANLAILRPFSEGSPVRKGLEMPLLSVGDASGGGTSVRGIPIREPVLWQNVSPQL